MGEPRRCVVVHPDIQLKTDKTRSLSSSHALGEAVGLTEAIHLKVCEAIILPIRRRTPKTLFGPGQVNRLKEDVAQHEAELIIVNSQLSPTQQRNLEKACHCKVIDRTALILEIFGERAHTAEGKLQVELAALNYQKSRLVRSWTHLERQRGGYGFMGGPGESQIETDRRLIAERITAIKQQLEKVVRTRQLHRKTRRDVPYPLVALVGYTNAGKSTLFNQLTGAKVLSQDQLFATLDPTIRAVTLPGGQDILLSDTVGFISDLPHELIAAFRATLEEVLEADLLVHVRDISHSHSSEQAEDVAHVLSELLGDRFNTTPIIEAWNKCDVVKDVDTLPESRHDDKHIPCSALTGEGCDALLRQIESTLDQLLYQEYHYNLPASAGKAIAWLHAHGHVTQSKCDDDRLHLTVNLRSADAARFEQDIMVK